MQGTDSSKRHGYWEMADVIGGKRAIIGLHSIFLYNLD
jgi:hypothetical protein